MQAQHDLLVIGGGVGGLVTASVAGQLGLNVVLIERGSALGGDCLHYGCVPTKSLIASAGLAHRMRHADRLGLTPASELSRLGPVMDRVRGVVESIQYHDDPERFRSYGVRVVFGAARFTGPREVIVGEERIRARRVVIATGAGPEVPTIEGLETTGYLTNETVFGLRDIPRRLAVIGGGPAGIELAQALSRLGSQVTVIQRGRRILEREDEELAVELEEILRREGLQVLTDTNAEAVESTDDGKRVSYTAPAGAESLTVDEILVAIGRRANIDDLDLTRAGVVCERGAIRVDGRMRTSARHVYACGDCCGPLPFTHAAEYQAGIIIANAVFRLPRRADYRAIPWTTFTDPELAQVGLSEADARARGLAIEVARYRFRDIDRALAEDKPQGQAKLIIHRNRLVGASILGAHAGELIHEAVLAVAARMRVGVLAQAVHTYPTLAQVIQRALNDLRAPRLFAPGPRRVARWLIRGLP